MAYSLFALVACGFFSQCISHTLHELLAIYFLGYPERYNDTKLYVMVVNIYQSIWNNSKRIVADPPLF